MSGSRNDAMLAALEHLRFYTAHPEMIPAEALNAMTAAQGPAAQGSPNPKASVPPKANPRTPRTPRAVARRPASASPKTMASTHSPPMAAAASSTPAGEPSTEKAGALTPMAESSQTPPSPIADTDSAPKVRKLVQTQLPKMVKTSAINFEGGPKVAGSAAAKVSGVPSGPALQAVKAEPKLMPPPAKAAPSAGGRVKQEETLEKAAPAKVASAAQPMAVAAAVVAPEVTPHEGGSGEGGEEEGGEEEEREADPVVDPELLELEEKSALAERQLAEATAALAIAQQEQAQSTGLAEKTAGTGDDDANIAAILSVPLREREAAPAVIQSPVDVKTEPAVVTAAPSTGDVAAHASGSEDAGMSSEAKRVAEGLPAWLQPTAKKSKAAPAEGVVPPDSQPAASGAEVAATPTAATAATAAPAAEVATPPAAAVATEGASEQWQHRPASELNRRYRSTAASFGDMSPAENASVPINEFRLGRWAHPALRRRSPAERCPAGNRSVPTPCPLRYHRMHNL